MAMIACQRTLFVGGRCRISKANEPIVFEEKVARYPRRLRPCKRSFATALTMPEKEAPAAW